MQRSKKQRSYECCSTCLTPNILEANIPFHRCGVREWITVRCKNCHGRMGTLRAMHHSCDFHKRMQRLRREAASPYCRKDGSMAFPTTS